MTIKVAIVEDNKSLRESIIALFSINEGFKLVGSFSNANSIVKDVMIANPDVVLMDIQMPGKNGIEAVKLLRGEFPGMKIVIQTVFEDDESIFQAICNGASGYILKRSTPNEYMQAIIEAYNGGAPITGSIAAKVLNMFKVSQQINTTTDFNLSDREKEVLNHLVKGLSYKMIADKCGISYDTVRFHMKNIYSKLHVESMTEAVSMAIKNKIV
jgi:DNA-binding NarL/FixJ family response regulator